MGIPKGVTPFGGGGLGEGSALPQPPEALPVQFSAVR